MAFLSNAMATEAPSFFSDAYVENKSVVVKIFIESHDTLEGNIIAFIACGDQAVKKSEISPPEKSLSTTKFVWEIKEGFSGPCRVSWQVTYGKESDPGKEYQIGFDKTVEIPDATVKTEEGSNNKEGSNNMDIVYIVSVAILLLIIALSFLGLYLCFSRRDYY